MEQETLSSWLYERDTGKRFADNFNGKEKNIKDMNSGDYYIMTVSIIKTNIDELKDKIGLRKAGKFVLDWKRPGDDKGKHCLYASKWKDKKEKIHCINSWGIKNYPTPVISPGQFKKSPIFLTFYLGEVEQVYHVTISIVKDSKKVCDRITMF